VVKALNQQFVRQICQPGKGPITCRYLTMKPAGWHCAKLTALRTFLDIRTERGEQTARGDNCEGVDHDAEITNVHDR
jgi:hypothetical protein